jgi:hypothetical protein
MPRRPSEYWARQCFTGASIMTTTELESRDGLGVDTIMFGTDVDERDALDLRRDALRSYGLDRDALQVVAERVGPTIDELLTAPDTTDDPFLRVSSKPSFLF